MKYILIFVLLVALISSFDGCSLLYDHKNDAVDSFDVGYSNVLEDAFIGDYNWDGTEEGMNIVIPEYYNKNKITGLGGYFGRGVPTPFMIMPTEDARNALCAKATDWMYVNRTVGLDSNSVQYLKFKLHISKYIEEVENLCAGGIIAAKYEESGETKYNVYILTCYVTCDADNKTFYAEDGKLYFRENDVLVEDIYYEDFDLEQHNEKIKEGYSVWIPFA